MRTQLDSEDLFAAARTQVRLLLQAGSRFDCGEVDEHLNIATRLRVLLHTSRTSHALLDALGLGQSGMFVSSGADVLEENLLPEHKLVQLGSIGGVADTAWRPRFDDYGVLPPLPLKVQIHRAVRGIPRPRVGGTRLPFAEWWLQPVLRDARRELFTRSDVVLKVANQDGGAHVDPAVDSRHHALTRRNSMGVFSGTLPKDSPVPATLRQIAWEVHATLLAEAPQLLPDDISLPAFDGT